MEKVERRVQINESLPYWPWANPPKVINLPHLMVGPVQTTPSTPSPLSDQPNHYKSTIDPYAYALANNLGALEMNILKYITRWKKKGGIDDLKKARNTLQRLIGHEENQIAERLHDRLGG
jgi:hypothetical protein